MNLFKARVLKLFRKSFGRQSRYGMFFGSGRSRLPTFERPTGWLLSNIG